MFVLVARSRASSSVYTLSLSISLAASLNFLPDLSILVRVGFFAGFLLSSVASVLTFSALRVSLACFSSTSATALALRFPDFAVDLILDSLASVFFLLSTVGSFAGTASAITSASFIFLFCAFSYFLGFCHILSFCGVNDFL
jgi:hypothetical protein